MVFKCRLCTSIFKLAVMKASIGVWRSLQTLVWYDHSQRPLLWQVCEVYWKRIFILVCGSFCRQCVTVQYSLLLLLGGEVLNSYPLICMYRYQFHSGRYLWNNECPSVWPSCAALSPASQHPTICHLMAERQQYSHSYVWRQSCYHPWWWPCHQWGTSRRHREVLPLSSHQSCLHGYSNEQRICASGIQRW